MRPSAQASPSSSGVTATMPKAVAGLEVKKPKARSSAKKSPASGSVKPVEAEQQESP